MILTIELSDAMFLRLSSLADPIPLEDWVRIELANLIDRVTSGALPLCANGCGKRVKEPPARKPAMYCSRACTQRAYEVRKGLDDFTA